MIEDITSLLHKDKWSRGDYEYIMRRFYAQGSQLRRIKALLELKRDDNEQHESKKLTSYQRSLKEELASYYQREINSSYSHKVYKGEYEDDRGYFNQREKSYDWLPYDPFSRDVPQQEDIDRNRSSEWHSLNRSITLLRSADFFASSKDDALSEFISTCYYNAALRNILAIDKTEGVLSLENEINRGRPESSSSTSSSSLSFSSGSRIIGYNKQEKEKKDHEYSYKIDEINANKKDSQDFEALAIQAQRLQKEEALSSSQNIDISQLKENFENLIKEIKAREDRFPPLQSVRVEGLEKKNSNSSQARTGVSDVNERTPLTASHQSGSNYDREGRSPGLLIQMVRGLGSFFYSIFRIFCG